VLSVSAGKDLESILAALLPHADAVTATAAEPHRSLPAAELAAAVGAAAPRLPVRAEPDPARALREARAALDPGDALVATGSIYLAGIARRILSEGPPPRPSPPRDASPVSRGRA
jgi:dihydrofolate synthase/folylpolyglutamate synthase